MATKSKQSLAQKSSTVVYDLSTVRHPSRWITVAAHIETLQRQAAPPTVKQHMAAIRMLFSWLTEKGVLAMNPPRQVKTERYSRTEGKTRHSLKENSKSFLDRQSGSTAFGAAWIFTG